MITHLKDRTYYEDLYDKITVDIGRRESGSLLDARELFYQKAKIKEEQGINAAEFWWDRIYWWLVELPYLLPRWEQKKATIDSWMARDREQDRRLADARPQIEPTCLYCNKEGLRLVTKDLLHRDRLNEQLVLFMFDCSVCKERSAYWEDGSKWVSPISPCPKCTRALDMDVKVEGKIMITTNQCSECGYVDIEKIDMSEREEQEHDPNYERDKNLFCLSEERAATMQAYRPKWEEAMRMMDDDMQRNANKEVYEAAAKIEQLKIPQLIERLKPVIEKAGYVEVTFDKPEIAGYVTIGFSCIDNDSTREDARSRKSLKKAITASLADSNWRLMSDGVSYRLGYLSGKLRAYENEEDLVKLVS